MVGVYVDNFTCMGATEGDAVAGLKKFEQSCDKKRLALHAGEPGLRVLETLGLHFDAEGAHGR